MRLSFEDCLFDSGTREVSKGGHALGLSPKAFQLLEILIAKRPDAVSKKDIHEQLVAQGYEVERKQIHLPEPLKEIGTHEVPVKLHSDVTAKVKVTVAGEG